MHFILLLHISVISGIKSWFEFSTLLIWSAVLFCFNLFSLQPPEYSTVFILVSQLNIYKDINPSNGKLKKKKTVYQKISF